MPSSSTLWHIDMFGTLQTRWEAQESIRFRASKAGACLAYCAFNLHRPVPREELVAQIWPEADGDLGRQSLRQTLMRLRRELESGGVPTDSVIVSDYQQVRLNADFVATDVSAFLLAAQRAERAEPRQERVALLERSVDLYGGDLLPGYYMDWVLTERERLAATYVRLLRLLVADLRFLNERERARDYALRALDTELLCEELYHDLMELYAEMDQPREGLRVYTRMKRLMMRELGTAPSEQTARLAQRLQAARQDVTPPPRPAAQPQKPSRPRKAETATPPMPTVANLPLRYTRFFGREPEIAALLAWLAHPQQQTPDRRMTTLIGPGGSGKTRLAIEVARRASDMEAWQVYFVPLADVSEPHRLPDAIASALQIPRKTGMAPLAQVVAALAGQPTLLVLDNLEHLVEAAGEIAESLLTALPQLTLLVTSRHRLDLDAERVLPVLPLEVPRRFDSPDHLLQFASVQLFVDRARAVSPHFQVTRRNAPAIAALCARLEGIPLAIELAAARSLVLTPAQMLVQLADRFGFLISERRTTEARHRTLRACLDWSFELLPAALQRFFSSLTVFRGGWTLEAAQAVCGVPSALNDLEQLCGRSLVLTEEVEGAARYRLLDSVREYVGERIRENLSEVVARHATHYLGLAEHAAVGLRGRQPAPLLAELEREHDNFRAALTSSVDGEIRLRLATALWRFWYYRSYFVEGAERLEAALAAAAEAPATLRGQALQGLGGLLTRQADYKRARQCLEESLAIRRADSDPGGVAETLTGLAVIATDQGDFDQAGRYHEEALAVWRTLDNANGIAAALNNLGTVCRSQGHLERAATYFSESVFLSRQLNQAQYLAISLNNLATVTLEQGQYRQALNELEECLPLCEQMGNAWGAAVVLHNMGEAHYRDGNPEAAAPLLVRSLQRRQALGDRAGMALTLDILASIARLRGEPLRAARLLAAAQNLRRVTGTHVSPVAQTQFDREAAQIRAEAGQVGMAEAETWAADASPEQIMTYVCFPDTIEQNVL